MSDLYDQQPKEVFRLVLQTVVGQAFSAAGYTLEERPTKWAGGQYRFAKALPDGLFGYIEFQYLYYSQGGPSRFRVTLIRTDQPNARERSMHPQYTERDLGTLVVHDFGVGILPSPNHWWQVPDTDALGKAVAEAGYLIVGYGIPWLAGELVPPSG